jgi:Fe2+ or Zn2+ uptake regulation protein
VSLATVYRNLRRLAAEGFLLERAGADGLRFDGNTGRHDHFTCLSCRRVFDVPPASYGGARRRIAARLGFEVLDHRVEFSGVCAACRGRRARRVTRTV